MIEQTWFTAPMYYIGITVSWKTILYALLFTIPLCVFWFCIGYIVRDKRKR